MTLSVMVKEPQYQEIGAWTCYFAVNPAITNYATMNWLSNRTCLLIMMTPEIC